MNELKRTPLYEEHIKLGGKMVEFGGWEMPIQYSNITEEHNSVRNDVGLFDVCHMGEVEISGQNAEKFVNYLATNDVRLLKNNEIQYSVMCYENGGVVDDLLVYKRDQNNFILIINAGNIDKDIKWISDLAKKLEYNININNVSDKISLISLQGPKAEVLLQQYVENDLSKLEFFKFLEKVELFKHECIISRSGYTGEDGFEIYTENKNIVDIWNKLLENGKKYNILPCGLGARDTLRYEANLPLYGHEFTEDISPLEAGYAFCVKLDKDDFMGKKALSKQKEEGLKRKIVGFELVDKGIARGEYPVLNSMNEVIGHVTTGYKSPTLHRTLGLALVDINYTKIESEIFIQVRNKNLKAKVISRKFLNKNYKK